MAFKIDTQMKGVYVISEDNIEHSFFNTHKTSKGLIVKNHYQEIERALYCAWCLREGKAYESVAAYQHSDKDLEEAPRLETVTKALEHQINLLTEGEYTLYANAVQSEDSQERRNFDHSRYWREIQDIYQEIRALKDGRYYENELHHRPGVPRIETIGKRMVDAIVDLVWRMDDDAQSIQERINEAFHKMYPDDEEPLWKDDEETLFDVMKKKAPAGTEPNEAKKGL